MTYYFKASASSLALVAMVACGGGSTSGDKDMIDDMDDIAIAPTISSLDVGNAAGALRDVQGYRRTPTTTILPTGTATYQGHVLAGIDIDGNDEITNMFGDLEIDVERLLAGDDVSGTVTNIHVLNRESPVQKLGGELTVDGTLDDGTKRISATMNGDLQGVFTDGEREIISVDGSMLGSTRDKYTGRNALGFNTYDVAAGVSGTTSGTISGGETGSFTGTFHGEEQ
ncbi:hypothetical protein SAMN04488515_1357 [Cognatiyoonia koreensis]|uniref:Transferrin-binding protein B C-lobe/N-lobe beta barrel domain-containing protein n=1 Tax=Cognatiyoonia koreensis TaxID=364200 RepID=A0A1I0PQF5_9RHOB|nr:hypothetical protein [Cognatiyoonia koreensis]SEW16501.1 hypothetical protein SAMN04488515_1357 [Cognatiyoonia koreensis]